MKQVTKLFTFLFTCLCGLAFITAVIAQEKADIMSFQVPIKTVKLGSDSYCYI